jgi:hypothetical protein
VHTSYALGLLPIAINATRDDGDGGTLKGYVYPALSRRASLHIAEIVHLETGTVLTAKVELFCASSANVNFTCNHFAAAYLTGGEAYEYPEE